MLSEPAVLVGKVSSCHLRTMKSGIHLGQSLRFELLLCETPVDERIEHIPAKDWLLAEPFLNTVSGKSRRRQQWSAA